MKKFLLSILPGALFSIAAPIIFYVVKTDNHNSISGNETIGSILLCLAVLGVVYGLAFWATKNAQAAGVIAVVLIVGIFYLWPIALALTAIVVVSIIALLILHRKPGFLQAIILLGGLGTVILIYYGVQFVSLFIGKPSIHAQTLLQPVIAAPESSSSVKPDIYYIVLDGYGGNDMLRDVYGYDNSDFTDSLGGLGFVVPEAGRTNYPYTVLSLLSSMNMQYLDGLTAEFSPSNDWWLVKDALQHSQVRAFLEANNYRTIFIASGFDYTDIRDGDEFIKPFPLLLNNFGSGFVRSTNLSALGNLGGFYSYPSYSTYRRLIQGGFEALPRAALEAGPKFVFVHITAPHPPFVFASDGSPVNPDAPFTMIDKLRDMVDDAAYKQSYIAELKYINQETLKAVQTVLTNSATPPVIILQGDHGPGLYLADSPEASCLYERFSILNAYYLPGKKYDAMPQPVTPVNTFRLVFNNYFSTNLPLLPNKNYFTNFFHFYDFQDVTGEIQPVCRENNQP